MTKLNTLQPQAEGMDHSEPNRRVYNVIFLDKSLRWAFLKHWNKAKPSVEMILGQGDSKLILESGGRAAAKPVQEEIPRSRLDADCRRHSAVIPVKTEFFEGILQIMTAEWIPGKQISFIQQKSAEESCRIFQADQIHVVKQKKYSSAAVQSLPSCSRTWLVEEQKKKKRFAYCYWWHMIYIEKKSSGFLLATSIINIHL